MKQFWRNPGFLVTLGLTVIVGLIPAVSKQAAQREVIFTMLMFIVLASSLNILLGYTGYVSFGHIVFFGIGGYVGFYMMSVLGLPMYIAIFGGGLASGLLAYLLGKAILRLRGAYFALATIGINEAARAFINNFDLFGGPTGLSLNFQVYKDYGGAMNALWITYWLMFILALIVLTVSFSVKSSKFGLGLFAIRENEDAAEVMGVVAPDAKTWAFVLSAVFPGMVGVLFFFKNGNILPGDAFRLHMSIEMIVMVMLGGQGTLLGPVLGAAGYQRLRGLLLVSPLFKNIQLAVAGILLLIIILFIPAGVVGWLRNRFPKLRRMLE
jgi:branched-chain amino acid transport system permease protein